MHSKPTRRAFLQTGMTLPELMIGMTLGLLILMGLTSLFVQSKKSFKQDDLTARMQEDARFAMGELRHDVGMAGFFANLLDGSVISEIGTIAGATGDTASLYTYTRALTVDDNGTSAAKILGQTLPDRITGTDAVGIVKVAGISSATGVTDPSGSTTDANVKAARDALLLANANIAYLQTNGVVGVMTTATNAPNTAATTTVPAEFKYWQYLPEVYWVRNYAVSAGDGIPTLCRKYLLNGTMTTETVAQGVEDFQIEYGIDIDSDGYADRYIAAPTTAQMDQLISVRIYVLMRTVEPDTNYVNDHTYVYSNSQIAPDDPQDSYYRRMFTTTIKVRNYAAYLMLNAIPK